MSIRLTITFLALAFIASPLNAQTQTQKGAVAGGVAGAILGGIAGHQNDETPEGIAIGGAVGAIAGGLLGRAQDNQIVRDYQHQQHRAQQHQQQVFQQQQRIQAAVSVNDVITLAQSGVNDTLIINQMRSSGVRQKIGVREIIVMHQNGVSEAVIHEMQQIGAAGVAVASSQPIGGYQRPVGPTVVKQPVLIDRPVVVTPRPVVSPRPVYRPQPTIVVDQYRRPSVPQRSARRHPGHYHRY